MDRQKLIEFLQTSERGTGEIIEHMAGHGSRGPAVALLGSLETEGVILFKYEIGKWSLLR